MFALLYLIYLRIYEYAKARLGFLMFALTNSGLGLAEAHVDLVWRVLVEGALTPEAAGELCEPYAPEPKMVGSKGHSLPAPMEEMMWKKMVGGLFHSSMVTCLTCWL